MIQHISNSGRAISHINNLLSIVGQGVLIILRPFKQLICGFSILFTISYSLCAPFCPFVFLIWTTRVSGVVCCGRANLHWFNPIFVFLHVIECSWILHTETALCTSSLNSCGLRSGSWAAKRHGFGLLFLCPLDIRHKFLFSTALGLTNRLPWLQLQVISF